MKQIRSLCVLLLCVLCLCGCNRQEEAPKNTCQIYYVSNSETKVEVQEHEMLAQTPETQVDELLTCLATMPEKLEYKAPLSMGFQVLDTELEDGKLLINVDEGYKNLSVTTEVLVRAAIVRTMTQLDCVSHVGMLVEGNQLYDGNGELAGWMNADQFINNDGNDINTYEQVRVKLYFADESGSNLIAAYREKHYSTNTPLERFVVEELISGPSGQIAGLYPSINPQTKIINVMTKDGICYVNLDNSFLTVVNNVSTETAVYSIVNSLVELGNVNKVQILINGETPANFTTTVFERNLDHVITLEK